MSKPRCINVIDFMQIACKHLRHCDASGLVKEIKSRWRLSQIITLLDHTQPEVRRVAVLVLGYLGEPCATGCLSKALRDEDEKVSELAEDSLWRIWLAAGNDKACASILRGIEATESEHYTIAIEHFTHALHSDPTFAEAYHQRSLAYASLDKWEACLEDCRSTLMHMPTHFAAMVGMGHCYIHLKKFPAALDCYQQAISLNPRLSAKLEPDCCKIRRHLDSNFSSTPDQSNMFELVGADRISPE